MLASYCALGTASAAVYDIGGTIVSTNAVNAQHEGMVIGTYDDATMALDVTVSFLLATSLNGMTTGVNSTITEGVSLSIGNPVVGGEVDLTSGSITFVSYASNASTTGANFVFPFTGSSHVVDGAYILTGAEETALLAGNIFTHIDGSDAQGFTALTATAVPEPSSALLLGLAGMSFMLRRKRA